MSSVSIDAGLSISAGSTGPVDNRPLTPQEYQMLQRLLSDPFSIPIEFKTWLVSYLETSDLTIPIGAVAGLKQILGVAGIGAGTLGILPAGLIFPYGGSIAPNGSLLCDGASYSRTAQSRLYSAIGTNYGSTDANSFSVPDLQERIPVGRGVKANYNTLNQNEGAPLGSRGTRHNHGSHAHIVGRQNQSLTPGTTAYSLLGDQSSKTATTEQQTVGPAGTPQDTAAYLVVNFIIVS
jgi:microcystin-dependent protein